MHFLKRLFFASLCISSVLDGVWSKSRLLLSNRGTDEIHALFLLFFSVDFALGTSSLFFSRGWQLSFNLPLHYVTLKKLWYLLGINSQLQNFHYFEAIHTAGVTLCQVLPQAQSDRHTKLPTCLAPSGLVLSFMGILSLYKAGSWSSSLRFC